MARRKHVAEEFPEVEPPPPEAVLPNEHNGPEFMIEREPRGLGFVIKVGPRGGDLPACLKGLFTGRVYALEAIHRYKMDNTNYKIDKEKHVA